MVIRLLHNYGMKMYDFDGCAVGLKSSTGLPIRKPWTVATSHEELGNRLSQFRCQCTTKHQPGRGEDLKRTEEYTFRMTDAIHRVLRAHPAAACIRQGTCVCSVLFPIPVPSAMAAMDVIGEILKTHTREELPRVAESVAQWEIKIKQFRAACAQSESERGSFLV